MTRFDLLRNSLLLLAKLMGKDTMTPEQYAKIKKAIAHLKHEVRTLEEMVDLEYTFILESPEEKLDTDRREDE